MHVAWFKLRFGPHAGDVTQLCQARYYRCIPNLALWKLVDQKLLARLNDDLERSMSPCRIGD
jgi:hypothetical protein